MRRYKIAIFSSILMGWSSLSVAEKKEDSTASYQRELRAFETDLRGALKDFTEVLNDSLKSPNELLGSDKRAEPQLRPQGEKEREGHASIF